jgi:hypothetical protein
MPTIYLTNLGTVAALKRGNMAHRPKVGPGSVSGILRFPPDWAYRMLHAHVIGFMPTVRELAAARSGHVTFDQYRDRLLRRWGDVERYAPGRLAYANIAPSVSDPDARQWDGAWWVPGGVVGDGATLCCVCADPLKCHRSVAAHVLKAAGWKVVLDGEGH